MLPALDLGVAKLLHQAAGRGNQEDLAKAGLFPPPGVIGDPFTVRRHGRSPVLAGVGQLPGLGAVAVGDPDVAAPHKDQLGLLRGQGR